MSEKINLPSWNKILIYTPDGPHRNSLQTHLDQIGVNRDQSPSKEELEQLRDVASDPYITQIIQLYLAFFS